MWKLEGSGGVVDVKDLSLRPLEVTGYRWPSHYHLIIANSGDSKLLRQTHSLVPKKNFYATSTASASCHLRTIWSLTSLAQGKPNYKELAIGHEASASYFADKVASLHWDFSPTIDTVKKLEVPCPSSGLVLDYFSQVSQKNNKILTAMRPTMCLLVPCPSWLVKACSDIVWTSLALSLGIFPEGLKKM